jgi:Cys-tRNA(Pro)/Cys-tRNA(Cys) deacylase
LVDVANKQPGGTPAIDELRRSGVEFQIHEFVHEPGEKNFGMVAAVALNLDPARVFKTLLVKVDDVPAVAIVPVDGKLSLKAMAVAVGGKKAVMMPPPEAERLTGYIVGGISPFGQKRRLATVLDETAVLFDTIFVSGGRRGLDLELSAEDLCRVLDARLEPIAEP